MRCSHADQAALMKTQLEFHEKILTDDAANLTAYKEGAIMMHRKKRFHEELCKLQALKVKVRTQPVYYFCASIHT